MDRALDEELKARLLEEASKELTTYQDLAAMVGVSRRTLQRERERDPVFSKRLRQAIREGRQSAAQSASCVAYRRLIDELQGEAGRYTASLITAYVNVLSHTSEEWAAKKSIETVGSMDTVPVPPHAEEAVRRALEALNDPGDPRKEPKIGE